jgi:hypothetical protein
MKQRNLASWLGSVLLLGALAVGGCDTGIDPDSLVRELRILGVRVSSGDPAAGPTAAELQAQIVPGAGGFDLMFTTSSVTLSSLVGAPTGQFDWVLCVGIRSLYSPGTVDPECRKWGPEDGDPKTNRSLVYLNPAGTANTDGSGTLTVPTDVLKGTLLAFLQTVLAGSGQGGTGGSGSMLPTRPLSILLPILLRVSAVGGSPTDNRDSEVGYNYLRVIIAAPAFGIPLPPPNHNPVLDVVIGSAQADGTLQPLSPCTGGGAACTPYAVPRSQGTFLSGQAVSGSLETYDALDDSGRTGITETLRFSWFASDGDFSELRTGTTRPQTQWRNGDKYPTPPETSTVSLWLVVQDERGGTDWQQYALQLQ